MRQVDARLGVAVTGQNSALASPQWEDVSRPHEIRSGRRHIGQEVHGLGTVDGTDTGGDSYKQNVKTTLEEIRI